MIDPQIYITIYFLFGCMCAFPWLFNWANGGAMPVTARLIALFVFAGGIFEGVWWMIQVYSQAPEAMPIVVKLVGPMLFFSVLGSGLVLKSLAKIVAANRARRDNNDDED